MIVYGVFCIIVFAALLFVVFLGENVSTFSKTSALSMAGVYAIFIDVSFTGFLLSDSIRSIIAVVYLLMVVETFFIDRRVDMKGSFKWVLFNSVMFAIGTN